MRLFMCVCNGEYLVCADHTIYGCHFIHRGLTVMSSCRFVAKRTESTGRWFVASCLVCLSVCPIDWGATELSEAQPHSNKQIGLPANCGQIAYVWVLWRPCCVRLTFILCRLACPSGTLAAASLVGPALWRAPAIYHNPTSTPIVHLVYSRQISAVYGPTASYFNNPPSHISAAAAAFAVTSRLIFRFYNGACLGESEWERERDRRSYNPAVSSRRAHGGHARWFPTHNHVIYTLNTVHLSHTNIFTLKPNKKKPHCEHSLTRRGFCHQLFFDLWL